MKIDHCYMLLKKLIHNRYSGEEELLIRSLVAEFFMNDVGDDKVARVEWKTLS